MRVTVTAGSWARRWLPNGSVELDLPADATAADLPELLGLPAEEAGLFSINGSAVPHGAALSDGDTVRVFPVVMGG